MTSPDKSNTQVSVPDWLLERYALNELPAERLEALRLQIEADPELAARLRDLRNHNRAVLMQHPPRVVARQIERRAGVVPARKARSGWWMAAPVVAMAAVALFFVGPHNGSDPDVLAKGRAGGTVYEDAPELRIFRADDGELVPGDVAGAGDVLGFRYHAQGRDFGALLSIDGAGVVTLHMPETVGGPLDLDDGLVTVNLGYELDDAPGFERFFLVLSESPFDLDAVLSAARQLADGDAETGRLELDTQLEVVDFVVDKDRR